MIENYEFIPPGPDYESWLEARQDEGGIHIGILQGVLGNHVQMTREAARAFGEWLIKAAGETT